MKVTPVTLLGTVEIGYETEIQRISADREDDRNGCGCSFGGRCSRRGKRNYRGRWVGYQISGQCRQSVEVRIGRAIFDCDIVAFDIASLLEALPNSTDLSII